jgi:tRNA (cmo5U34)-methyltransferase
MPVFISNSIEIPEGGFMDAKTVFSQAAAQYDGTRRKFVPCFDDFYGTAIERIPVRDNLRMLDLGAGTGLIAGMLAEAFPTAAITVSDVSQEMLEQARQRFEDTGHDVSFLLLDYLAETIPSDYDVIISGLSIHHTPHDAFGALISNIFKALKPGGIFINADQALGATPLVEEVNTEMWDRHARDRGATDEEIAVAVERMKADKMLPLDSQMAHLSEAGFLRVNNWYQNYRFVVYSGEKPAG